MRLRVFAPAKVNLTLQVTGRRSDGYHLLDSLVAFADVGDTITLSKSDRPRLDITGAQAGSLNADKDNLVVQALALFDDTFDASLEKNLPVASGIGGGSSDAAAALRGAAQLSGRALPDDQSILALGADVPVCVTARPARMQGIGEQLTPLALPPLPAVLVNPRVQVSTKAVFSAGSFGRHDCKAPPADPSATDLIAWLRTQGNDLQEPALDLAPEIGLVLQALEHRTGCRLARMSGSGATCFGLFDTGENAVRAATDLIREHAQWWVQSCWIGDQSARASPQADSS